MYRHAKSDFGEAREDILVERAQKGDVAALNALWELYSDEVKARCTSLTGDASVADDLVRDIYLKAYARLYLLHPESTFGSWLSRITRNVALGYLKQKPVRQSRGKAASAEHKRRQKATLRRKAGLQMNTIIENALHLLPSHEREMLILHMVHGYNIKEIAESLNYSEQDVRTGVAHARQRLRRLLEAGLEEPEIDSRRVSKTPAAKESSEPPLALDDRLLKRYHRLVDKRLSGALLGSEEKELQGMEEVLQQFEDSAASAVDRSIEQRHEAVIQELSDLTVELQKFRSGERSRSKIQ
jgi:RNA polymerase sigma-70 factor (ECF subfamily)